jgi:sirohydrochlorin cobaltochelatase
MTIHGLLLFAHGARDRRWAAPFEATAARLRALAPARPLRIAYLEFLPPTLAEAGAELVAAGCERIDIAPLFLGTGGHVQRDLPALAAALRAAHPQVDIRLHAAAGEQPAVIDALATWADSLAAP